MYIKYIKSRKVPPAMTNWILVVELTAFAWLLTMAIFVWTQHKWSKSAQQPKHDDVAQAIHTSAKFAFPVGIGAVYILTFYELSKLL